MRDAVIEAVKTLGHAERRQGGRRVEFVKAGGKDAGHLEFPELGDGPQGREPQGRGSQHAHGIAWPDPQGVSQVLAQDDAVPAGIGGQRSLLEVPEPTIVRFIEREIDPFEGRAVAPERSGQEDDVVDNRRDDLDPRQGERPCRTCPCARQGPETAPARPGS